MNFDLMIILILENNKEFTPTCAYTGKKFKYLGNEVKIGDQGRLQNDRHIGGVEQLDWI